MTERLTATVRAADGEDISCWVDKPLKDVDGRVIGTVTHAEPLRSGYATIEAVLIIDEEEVAQIFQGLPSYVLVERKK